MAEINLTQAEADALLAVPKIKVNDDQWEYPGLGGKLAVPLTSTDKREKFFLDLSRGRIDLLKGTYQNRGRHVVVLARLDFGGPPHRNPDGEEIASPHLHTYREGFGDKWAYPLPIEAFPSITDLWQSFFDFMRYCNITAPPNIQRGLFT